MKKLKWLDKNLELVIISVMIFMMTILLFVQAVARKITGYSIPWLEQFCCHLLVWAGMFGIPCSVRCGNAIKLDVILNFLPEKAKHIFGIIANIIVTVFFLWVLPPAAEVVKSQVGVTAKVMPYDMSVVYGISYIAIILLIVRLIQGIVLNVLALRKPSAGSVGKEEV